MANPPPRYTKPRVFVRSVESITYGLAEMRRQHLATIPHIISYDYHDCIGEGAVEKSLISPGKEPFLTQSLHCHFVTVGPGGRDKGHGHQNEALFYILQGKGFDMHDGVRYDWEAGDAVAVHNDSVHWHNNPDPKTPFVALIIKAKPPGCSWACISRAPSGQWPRMTGVGTSP
jgi:quercetin dioxygenase-like cupin family protein